VIASLVIDGAETVLIDFVFSWSTPESIKQAATSKPGKQGQPEANQDMLLYTLLKSFTYNAQVRNRESPTEQEQVSVYPRARELL
jgi:hypothetical protein